MGRLTITFPGEAVLFSIKTVITRGGMTQPPTEGILADLDEAHPYAAKTSPFSPQRPFPRRAALFCRGGVREKDS